MRFIRIKAQFEEANKMNIHFHGINFYSKQPQRLFDFYKALGFRIVQEKESDSYYGAALALTDEKEPVIWIWAVPENEETHCCNNLYFTTNGKLNEVYENIKAVGIDCPAPVKTAWGGMEMMVTDPDGNTILFL